MSAVLQSPRFIAAQPQPLEDTLPGAAELRERFAQARQSGKRAKDAAEHIGISEGAAIAAHTGSHAYTLKATPLQGPWVDVLQSLELCGPVMALTRNAGTVHEKVGIYQNISATGHMGLALGDEIDLRLFFSQWHAGFAVLEAAASPGNPPAQSLQFFDAQGTAVHKIFVRPETDREAFDSIAAQYAASSEQALASFVPAVGKAPSRPDADIDKVALLQGWQAMTDTHQFFGLIHKHGVERQQAFRLVEGAYTQRAELTVVQRLLEEAAIDGTSIMVFVSSSGCIQIHSGKVQRIESMVSPAARWINVLDSGFNLHLREDCIANAWLVKKPTADGIVTSVEVFDHEGELMAMFFGSRKPGVPELQAWRDIAARLPLQSHLAVEAAQKGHFQAPNQAPAQ